MKANSLQIRIVNIRKTSNTSLFLFQKTLGIITLEDIIEELIQEDIYDESDLSRLQKKVQNRLNKMFKGKQQRGLPRQKSYDPTGRNVVSRTLLVQYLMLRGGS